MSLEDCARVRHIENGIEVAEVVPFHHTQSQPSGWLAFADGRPPADTMPGWQEGDESR